MKQGRLRRHLRLQSSRFWRLLRRSRVALAATIAVLVLLTLTSRLLVAYCLANDAPGDGVVYARLATNLLDHGVFSTETEDPISPTMIRMPGYPIFLGGIYYLFGEGNNTAVRLVQAVFDTATCILAGLIAYAWTTGRKRRRAALWAYILASLCPFIVIYTATILTETLTTFFMAAMVLTGTLALKSSRPLRCGLWWAVTGLLCGAAVMLRPDAGLFAAGLGLTLVVVEPFLDRDQGPGLARRLLGVAWKGTVFSILFILVLTPWTIRNWRLWGVLQPLSPAHAEMPGEFVPFGYDRWLKTWVDDSRYTEPMLWNLGDKQIPLSAVRANSFDSPEEKQEVASLLDRYNNPPGSNNKKVSDDSDDQDDSSDSADGDPQPDDTSSADEDQPSGSDETDADDEPDDDTPQVVRMTPEIDAEFGRIADERIARSPVRYYVWLPIKRAGALWFDSHSLYWPFGGQMSKIADLDYDENQQYWLPLFTLLTWGYTALACLGIVALWRGERSRKWLVLLSLMTLPRIAFLSTVENPEPRYVVELFIFTAIAGGIWLSSRGKRARRELSDSRMLSLDVFRGITIAGMTLVNEPGTWDAVYPPLLHAEWNGATPADWVFPFFLFIVGVSISFALARHARSITGIYARVIRRTCVLFALGLLLNLFPIYNLWTGLWFQPSHVRVMGVLQRIAICYAAAAIIFLKTRWRTQLVLAAVLLLGYWALMALLAPPGCSGASATDINCNLAAYVDQTILGHDHMWTQSQGVDPEGLLSTIPALATTILGLLAGQWLRSDTKSKTGPMLAAGAALVAVGWAWSFAFPLNKSLWTSSYVLYTGGLAAVLLASLYWIVDLKGWKKWAAPFIVFGTNAIALYVGSSLFGEALGVVELEAANDTTQTLQERIFANWFAPYADPLNASLLYAVAFIVIWLVIIWTLYRKRIFLKV